MASILTVGSFVSQDNEANLVGINKRVVLSPRGKRMQKVIEWRVEIEAIGDTVADIISRASTIEASFDNDASSAAYSVNGITAHTLPAGSVSGVRAVLAGFPSGAPEELCTQRKFSATISATYDMTAGDDIVFFQESISTEGDGGPLIVVVTEVAGIQTLGGLSAEQIAPRTPVYYTQSGKAIGYSTYPVPPPPFNPDGHFGYLQKITRTGGRQVGNGIRFYSTQWYYRMGRDVQLFGSLDPIPTSR